MEEFDNMFRPVNEKTTNYIKVIGVGGGGGNAVNHMFEAGIEGVDFVLCNTDKQALSRGKIPTKIHLGDRELGAGNDPNVGREAALMSEEQIRQILDDQTKMIFVTAGMGGGTGTGAAPVVARFAKEKGILTVGIVTLPFDCEGLRRKRQAINGIEELKKNVDTLIVISSDKLRDEYGNMGLTSAFHKADDILKAAAKGIAEIITVTGYINVDFEDVKTVMKDSGKALMGTGRASGENRAEEAIRQAITSPLLNDSNIEGAKNVLLNITYGKEEITLDETVEITDYVQKVCGNEADVIYGIGQDDELGNDINVTLVATGFENKKTERPRISAIDSEGPKEPKDGPKDQNKTPRDPQDHDNGPTIHTLDENTTTAQPHEDKTTVEDKHPDEEKTSTTTENNNVNNGPTIHTLDEDNTPFTPHTPVNQPVTHTEPQSQVTPEPTISTKIYDNPFNQNDDDEGFVITNHQNSQVAAGGSNEVATVTIERQVTKTYDPKEELKRNRLKSLSLNYKTQKGLEELERQPAYMRVNPEYEAVETNDEVSRYATSSKGVSTENSFLHDNVD